MATRTITVNVEKSGSKPVIDSATHQIIQVERDNEDLITLYTDGDHYFVIDQDLLNVLKTV